MPGTSSSRECMRYTRSGCAGPSASNSASNKSAFKLWFVAKRSQRCFSRLWVVSPEGGRALGASVLSYYVGAAIGVAAQTLR